MVGAEGAPRSRRPRLAGRSRAGRRRSSPAGARSSGRSASGSSLGGRCRRVERCGADGRSASGRRRAFDGMIMPIYIVQVTTNDTSGSTPSARGCPPRDLGRHRRPREPATLRRRPPRASQRDQPGPSPDPLDPAGARLPSGQPAGRLAGHRRPERHGAPGPDGTAGPRGARPRRRGSPCRARPHDRPGPRGGDRARRLEGRARRAAAGAARDGPGPRGRGRRPPRSPGGRRGARAGPPSGPAPGHVPSRDPADPPPPRPERGVPAR